LRAGTLCLAALSNTDRAQSVYWAPTLRAAWMIARFSPGRNRTVMNSPRQSRFAIGGLPIFAMSKLYVAH
jgi:hypothetical protein